MAEKLTTITYGESGVLEVSLTNLVEQGLSFGDIAGAKFALKIDADDVDADAVFFKESIVAGVVVDAANELIKVDIDTVDYGDGLIERNSKYLMILLIDWGDGVYREDYDPKFERKLFAAKDKWRG